MVVKASYNYKTIHLTSGERFSSLLLVIISQLWLYSDREQLEVIASSLFVSSHPHLFFLSLFLSLALRLSPPLL